MLRLLIAAGGALAIASCGGPPPCPAVYANPQLQVPASNVAPDAAHFYPIINAATSSAPDGVAVSIVASQGTVAYDGRGPFPAFIYAQDAAPNTDAVLYAGLGVGDGVWFPFWLYCTSDGRLTGVYGEMSDRDANVFPSVEGVCTNQGSGAPPTVSLPAHTLSPIALTCGVTASAPAPSTLDLMSSSVGSMSFPDGVSSVYPFHGIDCREGCGSPGWYELHSILWNPTTEVASFAIFYLDDMGVSLDNGVALPSGDLVNEGVISGATGSISR